MTLDLPALASWLWEAACIIRSQVDTPKFKDHLRPLIFLNRPSDVFEDEIKGLVAWESRRAALAALCTSLLHHRLTARLRLPEFVNQNEIKSGKE